MENKKTKIISHFSSINSNLIDKDILLTQLLQIIINNFNNKYKFFLRGGTSLSKCYLQTNRLSEDIDLTIVSSSKTQAKEEIKIANEILDQLEKKNVYKITKRDVKWNKTRNYLNMEIEYKRHNFLIDIKSICASDAEYQLMNLIEKNIYDIYDKFEPIDKSKNRPKIDVLNLEFVIAEKMIAFNKKYNQNQNDIRTYRHLYDIFMIFDSKLLENNLDTWNKIVNIYQCVIKNTEKEFKIDFKNNICFNQEVINSYVVKQNLNSLIQNECYKKIKANKIIDFFSLLKIDN